MPFDKCPECAETNFREDVFYTRTFDCGFRGQHGTRTKRCGSSTRRGARQVDVPAEVARYRLALLDAAQAAETIGNDMAAQGESQEFAARCRELARQMRAFAGHTASGETFDDGASGATSSRKTGASLARILRKARPW